jgi:hypothetical protein
VRREEIRGLLAGGLKTEAFPRDYTQDEIQAVVAQTRGAGLETKLVIGGFTLTPVTDADMEQACEICVDLETVIDQCLSPALPTGDKR